MAVIVLAHNTVELNVGLHVIALHDPLLDHTPDMLVPAIVAF